MPNKIFTVVLCFLVLVSLFGCGTGDSKEEDSVSDTQASHSHDFLPATCFNPKTCSCGATEGEALGHRFNDATCTDAATCCRCGVKDGNKYVRTDFTTLNKVDMTLGTISVYHDYEQAIMKGNISNGLFSVSFDVSNYPALYFYDLNGNMVIDLSEYKTGWQWPFFSNGECEIEIINNNDTEYIITIDKEGNVLDSVKKSD